MPRACACVTICLHESAPQAAGHAAPKLKLGKRLNIGTPQTCGARGRTALPHRLSTQRVNEPLCAALALSGLVLVDDAF